MKVKVQCRPSDVCKDTNGNSLENLAGDISELQLDSFLTNSNKNSFHDIPICPAETSLENPLEDSNQSTPQDTIRIPEGETSGQNEPIYPAHSVWWELGRLMLKIVAIAACLMLIVTFLYGFYRNSDPDMAPMVKDGDLLLFYRLDKDYAAGDLLLLDFQGERQVRRVVARASDTVDITENGLVVNGSLKNEPEIFEQTLPYENGVSFPLTVGEGQVFTLGDARENATDSRVYGPVDMEDTLGTVITVMRRRGL